MVGVDAFLTLGLDSFGLVGLLVFQWLIVFAVNVIPALMPPTWAVLSFLNIYHPQDIFILVAVGVSASTCGRFVLAKLSAVAADKFAGKQKKHEFDSIRKSLEKKPLEKFLFTFVYSLSPLPSNALFIAFGATKTRMREALAGFLIGRTISYLFLVFTTQKVFSSLEATAAGSASLWTIAIEVLGVIGIGAFFFVDWNKIIAFGTQGVPKGAKKKKKWAS